MFEENISRDPPSTPACSDQQSVLLRPERLHEQRQLVKRRTPLSAILQWPDPSAVMLIWSPCFLQNSSKDLSVTKGSSTFNVPLQMKACTSATVMPNRSAERSHGYALCLANDWKAAAEHFEALQSERHLQTPL
jgi:hypothetical protein